MNEQQINGGRMQAAGLAWEQVQPQSAELVYCPVCPSMAGGLTAWAWIYQSAYVQAQESVRRELWLRRMQPGLN
jgi:hypothetical protein